VVAIKQKEAMGNQELSRLKKVEHQNVVHFLAAFQDNDHLYLVYESIRISLSEIKCYPYGPFKEFELTAIYKARGHKTDFSDIKSGVCGPWNSNLSQPGYDLCTGVGSPVGYGAK